MQIVIILALISSLVLTDQQHLKFLAPPSPVTVLLLAEYVLVAIGLSFLNVRLGMAAIRKHTFIPARITRQHNRLEAANRLWLVAGFIALTASGHGRLAVGIGELLPIPIPFVSKLILISPFLITLVLKWIVDYPFQREIRVRMAETLAYTEAHPALPVWTRRQYIVYSLRHQLLLIALPISLILTLSDVLTMYLLPALPEVWKPYVMVGGSLAVAFSVFLVAPFLLVRVWSTTRLQGPLRDELDTICSRLKLRYRDILIWKSDGVIANAAVMGLLPNIRYILISDGILERMSPKQIRAIFAHEAGHILSHHILYSVLFLISSLMLVGLASELVRIVTGGGMLEYGVLTIVLSLAAFVFGFGFVSRRFERQSDVIGAWASADEPAADGSITAEGSAIFARSLERVAELNCMPPNQRNWRHGSIAQRARYILWLGSSGGNRSHIDRVVRRIKIVTWLLLLASIAMMFIPVGNANQ